MVLNKQCPTCDKPAHLICTGCKDIQYCSKECQETDRPSHKMICHTAYTDRPEGHPDVRRVLFFPEGNAQPDMLWVKVEDELDDEAKLLCRQPVMKELMESEWPPFDIIRENAITGAPLGYHIHLCYEDDVPIDEDNLNKAVIKATHEMAPYPWRGPILAFCGIPDPADADEDDADIVEVLDMDMTAYSHVVAYLLDRDHDDFRFLQMKGPKIEAVEIGCDGATPANDSERYRAIQIPRLHPRIRNDEGEISAISDAIGMKFVCLKWRTSEGLDHTNTVATTILARINPQTTTGGFGWPGTSWPKKIGTVVVFREDLNPLDVDTAKAFAAYCKAVVQKCRKAEQGKLTKHEALAGLSKRSWEAFMVKWEGVKSAVTVMRGREKAEEENGFSGVEHAETNGTTGNDTANGHH